MQVELRALFLRRETQRRFAISTKASTVSYQTSLSVIHFMMGPPMPRQQAQSRQSKTERTSKKRPQLRRKIMRLRKHLDLFESIKQFILATNNHRNGKVPVNISSIRVHQQMRTKVCYKTGKTDFWSWSRLTIFSTAQIILTFFI